MTVSILPALLTLAILLIGFVNPAHGEFDSSRLPEGMSQEEAEVLGQEALEQLLSDIIIEGYGERARKLQGSSDRPCNTLVGSVTKEELREDILGLLEERNIQGAAKFALDVTILSFLVHDVQIWKVCGRCSDFSDAYPKDVGCREQDYGYNALHSGILVAPYDEKTGKLLEGTLPVNIVPSSGGFVPSDTETHPITNYVALLGAFAGSATRAFTLIPDYIGLGESTEYYRAFLVQQSILTAAVPLVWQAENLVSEVSNCATAMGDEYTMVGYSQGGYSAVSLAIGLSKMGKKIIALHSAGAPYRLSTSTLTSFVKTLSVEKHDIVFFITLLAAALSSTTTDAANFGQGQDFLADHLRDELVAKVQVALTDRAPIYDFIPNDDPLSIFNPDLIAQVERAIALNQENPCEIEFNENTDKLCKALQDQDLVEGLETATYPVYLCHSRDDQLIPYSNLPDMDANPEFLHLNSVSGEHKLAAVPCLINILLWYVNPLNLKAFTPEEKTLLGGCNGGGVIVSKEDAPCGLLGKLFGRC